MKTSKAIYTFLIIAIVSGGLSCGKSGDPNYDGNNPNVQGALIYITATGYNPRIANVAKGTTVTWRNNDNKVHDVRSDDGTYVVPDIPPTGQYSITAHTSGNFTYHCSHHSDVTAELRVGQ